MSLGLIWAQANGGVIGFDGTMPWHLPEDLKHFKEVTLGARVVMGRRTWESLPERFRPLPGRTNVVVTRNNNWEEPGVSVAHTIDDALETDADTWVMGGAQIYEQCIEHASRLEVTEINSTLTGDTYAPSVDSSWKKTVQPETGWFVSRAGLEYRFVSYQR